MLIIDFYTEHLPCKTSLVDHLLVNEKYVHFSSQQLKLSETSTKEMQSRCYVLEIKNEYKAKCAQNTKLTSMSAVICFPLNLRLNIHSVYLTWFLADDWRLHPQFRCSWGSVIDQIWSFGFEWTWEWNNRVFLTQPSVLQRCSHCVSWHKVCAAFSNLTNKLALRLWSICFSLLSSDFK